MVKASPIYFTAFCYIFLSHFICAQRFAFEKNITALHEALLNSDSSALSHLLHDSASFGHSNGLIESKRLLWQNLKNKKIQYHEMTFQDLKILSLYHLKVVRYTLMVNVDLDQKNYKLKLHNQQTWVKSRNRWQLLARQSTRLPDP
jgi:hypothetical protein